MSQPPPRPPSSSTPQGRQPQPRSSSPSPLQQAAPLTADQLGALADARRRMKGIRRAVTAAQFDGWTVATFAGLTFLGGFFGPIGFVLGAAMGAVAGIELYFAARLKSLDPRAPRILAINQLVFASVLIAYAAWCLLSPTPISAEIRASARDLKSIGIDFEQMNRQINLLIYGGLIIVALFGQGALALFYWRRQKMVREYLSQTPVWIVQMQRAGVGV